MKRFPARSFFAISSSVAVAVFLAFVADTGGNALRAQDAKGAPKAGPQGPGGVKGKGKGQFKGKGRGRAAVDTLGAGPWDFDTETAKVHVSVVTKGLDHPWGLAFLPGGDMLVTERGGRLRVVRDGTLDPAPIGGLPEIRTALLGGLMDIALHPNFAQNRLIYFSYSKPGAEDAAHATTAVARAHWDGGPTLANVEDIFVAEPYFGGQGAPRGCCGQGPADGSYGSRIVFDNDGYLFITIGDRNYGELSQDPSVDIGKIVRLRDDGSIPPDNPFVGREGYRPEIWSLGHRNPLGLTIHPVTGELWSSEFGPRGGDEVNRIVKGGNYGWIEATHGTHYDGTPGGESKPGWVEPVLSFVPSINPGNLTFYNGGKFPQWRGNLLMGVMTQSVLRVTFDAQGQPAGQERMLGDLHQRFRDTRAGPDGLLYLLTDETFGAVLKVEPAP